MKTMKCVGKCECEECGGTGRIECPECDGQGELSFDIEDGPIHGHVAEEELRELQKDWRRVQREADELKRLRPERAAFYDARLKAAQEEIAAKFTEALQAEAA